MPDVSLVAEACESLIFMCGLVALWRTAVSPAARALPKTTPLVHWDISRSSFFLSLWVIFIGYMVPGVAAVQVLKHFPDAGDNTTVIVVGTSAQLGMFFGWLAARFLIPGTRVPVFPAGRTLGTALRQGLVVFLAAMPVVIAAGAAWQGLLKLAGIPVIPQDLVGIFENADSPAFVVSILLLAVCGAPLSEELVFRAGLFGFARTRLPRALALLLPALLFGLAHANLATLVPLIALGAIFSIAYERTGDIRVAMVAHALFNLNSSLLALLGVDS